MKNLVKLMQKRVNPDDIILLFVLFLSDFFLLVGIRTTYVHAVIVWLDANPGPSLLYLRCFYRCHLSPSTGYSRKFGDGLV